MQRPWSKSQAARHIDVRAVSTSIAMRASFVRSRSYWICTARPDGRPHSIPVWGMWVDGALYFGTARDARKAKNIAHNPAVSVHLESGDDVVILEGKASEIDLSEKKSGR